MGESIDLKSYLIKEMQTDFWQEFMDAWSDELTLFKSDILSPLEDTFNIRNLTTIAQLQEITKMFGYYPDTSLNSSVDYYKSEINSISYRIKRKTTYAGYDYIFKSIPITGYVYNVLWDDVSMVKAWDETSIETYLASYDFYSPFIYTLPEEYYSFFEDVPFTLDSGYYLDDGLLLDTNVLKETTHHLAIEIIPVSLQFTVDSSEPYLMTNDYLDYVLHYVNYNRKVTEVPHVGVQISLITDTSRYYNNLNSGLSYTVPDLKANFAVTQNWSYTTKEETMHYIAAGVGLNQMWGIGETPGDIDSLDEELFEKELSVNEVSDDGNYYKVNTYIPSGTIKNIVLFVGDGSTYQRSGFTKYGNIIPKSFYLTYYANNQEFTISDSTGVGTIETSVFIGTIDYDTGEYELNFVNSVDDVDTISAGGVSSISTNLSYNNIQLNTVEVTYTYGGDDFIARSDAAGNITGTFVSSGTVTADGAISITFSITIDTEDVICNYTYDNYGIPTNGYPVKLSYRTEEVVRLREIGIKDENGVLVACGTIPPCYIENRDFHLGLELFIKKP